MTKRRVLAISGIRSEYFLQRAIFRAIMDHPDLELELVVTGAHLSTVHGHTVDYIEADGFPIVERIESLIDSNRDASRLKGAASQLQVLAHIVDSRRPDWLLATGDREEAINIALCGAYMNLATAHYSAGDRVVGNVDDMVRHSVSRLAHLLLTTNEDARSRLVRAGEEEWRVHNVGHTGLDRLGNTPKLSPKALAKELNVQEIEATYLMVIQHPISSEIEDSGQQMLETLTAVATLGVQTFICQPNSDPGSQNMLQVFQDFNDSPKMHFFKTIPDLPFVNLLRGAAALIGNSSLGILEAPFLGLPVINVGNRQAARHHAENVVFVPHDRDQILQQVRRFLDDDEIRENARNCSNPFGDGHSGPRVANLLAETPLDHKLLNKKLAY